MSYAPAFSALTRELRLVIDLDSQAVKWCDEPAARLGVTLGTRFPKLALEGTADKLRELVARATTAPVTGWECAVVLGGRPMTALFGAARVEGSINELAVIASLAAQDYADAVAEAGKAMHEIVGLHREVALQKARLEESNTAIRALMAELEQTADRLRTTAEIKQRLIASMSHEFRTPLHSIIGLSKVLLANTDGELSGEQRQQVTLVSSAAAELSGMIDDTLELARLDAGRTPLRIETFELRELLAAVAGSMRPLIRPNTIELVVDPAPDVALETDHGKLSQIVRNLVANALKFTTKGEVRVTATLNDNADELSIAVKDTGIGIAEADHARIFDEFVQVDSARQREVKGSGLGLPLARKLAESLGGSLELRSELGKGSTFTVTLPMEHSQVSAYRHLERESQRADPQRPPILVVEDDRDLQFGYDRLLAIAGFQALPARTVAAARGWLANHRPAAIILDIMLEGEDTWNFLGEIQREHADIPVMVCSVMGRKNYVESLGAEFWAKPLDEDKLLARLQQFTPGRGASVLLIDDDATGRYLIKKHLQGTSFELHEAATGTAGIELARSERPDIILLDYLHDRQSSIADVLDRLANDPRTSRIPIIVVTSHALPGDQKQRLADRVRAILSKDQLSHDTLVHHIREALR